MEDVLTLAAYVLLAVLLVALTCAVVWAENARRDAEDRRRMPTKTGGRS